VFQWVCPGKAEKVGYHEWKRRLVSAVGIFGRGNVGTGLVGGVELARPNGFATEHDALAATLDEAEDLASHGVTTVYIVWVRGLARSSATSGTRRSTTTCGSRRGSTAPRKYGPSVDFGDYRRCGNHPDSDPSRLL
jgi:hypothetical protein